MSRRIFASQNEQARIELGRSIVATIGRDGFSCRELSSPRSDIVRRRVDNGLVANLSDLTKNKVVALDLRQAARLVYLGIRFIRVRFNRTMREVPSSRSTGVPEGTTSSRDVADYDA